MPSRETRFNFGRLFFFASTVFASAYLASTLSSRLRKREAEVVELSRRLQRANNRLETLYEAGKAITSTLELAQVLERLARATAQAMGILGCSIFLLDETGQRLYLAGMYGLSDAYAHKGDLILERNPLAREVLAGKVIAIGDVAMDRRLQYLTEAIAEGIRSILSAPLIGKRGSLGLIRAYSNETNHFTHDDETFLSGVASQGSIAIENAMAYEALGKLDQMKSQFVLTVTHELRSPISVVHSLMRTLSLGYAGTLAEPQRDLVERAQHRADFLQTLVDDLLDLAAGKSELGTTQQREEINLGEAAEQVVKRFSVSAQEKHIALEWHCDCGDQPIGISAVSGEIDRILNNLISNAIKYTPMGGRVSVTLCRAGDEARLEVSDTGIGIPEDALPHLVTPQDSVELLASRPEAK